jgi:hypothetical protein
MKMCLLCGHCLMQLDPRSPGSYGCPCCGNRESPSQPQLRIGFVIGAFLTALVAGLILFCLQ